MKFRVALFEPESGGHHLIYTKDILSEGLRRGWDMVLVTTERATRSPGFEAIRQSCLGDIEVSIMPDTESPDNASDLRRLKDQFRRRQDYAIGLKRLRSAPDVAFMLNIDRADLPISLLGSPFGRLPYGGFLVGRQFHCPAVGVKTPPLRRRDKLAGPVFHRLIRQPTLGRVLTVDESLRSYAEMRKPKGWQKVVHVHDAAHLDLSLASSKPRDVLGLPHDKFIVLAYGSLSLRKGVEELLRGLEDIPSEIAVVMAGRQDADIQRLLKEPVATKLRSSGQLFEFNRFIDEKDEANLFAACDAVWVGYRYWFGMSAVLMQAGAAGKPLLAMHDGLVGYLTDRHQLGMIADIQDRSAVRESVITLAKDPNLAKKLGANGKQFSTGRTPEAFASEICNHIAALKL